MGLAARGIGARRAVQTPLFEEYTSADPTIAPGLQRPIGWRVLMPDGSAAWDKTGAAATAWAPVTGGGGGAVASVNGQVGAVAVAAADAALGVSAAAGTITISQVIAAEWTLANVRYYALDGTRPNDSGAGFSDVSEAAAGLVAKKTLAGLLAILPRVGNGRKIVIAVRAGSYAGQGDFGQLISGLTGFASGFPIVVATDTVASAGATAFQGDAADRQCAGFTTAPGMNAAGYNPTGALSASLVQCVKAGGGAPGFGAEPAAPLFYRMRFDVATTTAALRNVSRWVRVVTGTDTVTPQTAFPAVPAGTDVFYLEGPGVTVDSFSSAAAVAAFRTDGIIVGLNITGVLNHAGAAQLRLVGCSAGTVLTSETGYMLADNAYSDEGGSRTVGMGLRSGGVFTNSAGSRLQFSTSPAIGVVGSFNINGSVIFGLPNGSACFGGASVSQSHGGAGRPSDQIPAALGGDSHVGQPASRVRGNTTLNGIAAGVHIRESDLVFDILDISGEPAATPAVALHGKCALGVSSNLTGTGNTDVGLDMTLAAGSDVLIYSQPTLTGAAGDVRFPDASIHTWAALIGAGITTDTKGNRYIAA